jgi:hypothetical protein
VINILVQPERDWFAAQRFFRQLLRTTGRQLRVIITDKLRSYGAAKEVVLPRVRYRQSRYLNNRAETRISRRDCASAGCAISNRRNRHKDSSNYTSSLLLVSGPSGYGIPAAHYSVERGVDYRFGVKSRLRNSDGYP